MKELHASNIKDETQGEVEFLFPPDLAVRWFGKILHSEITYQEIENFYDLRLVNVVNSKVVYAPNGTVSHNNIPPSVISARTYVLPKVVANDFVFRCSIDFSLKFANTITVWAFTKSNNQAVEIKLSKMYGVIENNTDGSTEICGSRVFSKHGALRISFNCKVSSPIPPLSGDVCSQCGAKRNIKELRCGKCGVLLDDTRTVGRDTIRIIRDTDNAIICERCQIADNILTRVRGLLGRTHLDEDEGLLIVPCPSIHMFGMKFALDVVFLSRENVVVDVVENIAPGKHYVAKKTHGKAHSALELSVGTVKRHAIEIGQTLRREN